MLSAFFMVIVLFVPFLRELFGFAILSERNRMFTILLSFAPVAVVEVLKKFKID
ncbi:hypothetical protein D3C73_1608590 [compost metagenome]